MAQWTNLHWNNNFLNRTRLPLLREKSGAILLVLVGLKAGSPADRRNTGRFENFKNSVRISSVGFSWHFTKHSVIIVFPMYFSQFFQVKYIVRRVIEVRKSGTPCFFMSIPTIKH